MIDKLEQATHLQVLAQIMVPLVKMYNLSDSLHMFSKIRHFFFPAFYTHLHTSVIPLSRNYTLSMALIP